MIYVNKMPEIRDTVLERGHRVHQRMRVLLCESHRQKISCDGGLLSAAVLPDKIKDPGQETPAHLLHDRHIEEISGRQVRSGLKI